MTKIETGQLGPDNRHLTKQALPFGHRLAFRPDILETVYRQIEIVALGIKGAVFGIMPVGGAVGAGPAYRQPRTV